MGFTPPPADQQGLLVVGERLADLPFVEPGGQPASLYSNFLYGFPKVVLLAPDLDTGEAALGALAARHAAFNRVQTHVVAVTAAPFETNAALKDRLGIRYLLLSDEAGRLAAAAQNDQEPRVLFFDELLRFQKAFAGGALEQILDAAQAHAEAHFAGRPPSTVTAQPPVLLLPGVLEPDYCKSLVEHWRRSPKNTDSVASQDAAAKSGSKIKSRRDTFLPYGSPELEELKGWLDRRLLPDIEKAFAFKVTRLEPFRIGRYDASCRGHFGPHRDNTAPSTSHRRLALSINLNDGNRQGGDYEGGYLHLPEYGPQLHTALTGGAMVFSCSLLHQVTPVTRGKRYVLLGFFWGEGEQSEMHASHPDLEPGFDLNRIG